MNAERWLPIPSHEGYEVSDLGRVRSFRNNRWGLTSAPRVLSQRDLIRPHARSVYKTVRLGRGNAVRVHQLVLAAFVGPCPPKLMVRHLNGDGRDNSLDNLKYGTAAENALDSVEHGTNAWASRTHCQHGHPYSGDNLISRRDHPGRSCRECERQRHKIRNAKRGKKAA